MAKRLTIREIMDRVKTDPGSLTPAQLRDARAYLRQMKKGNADPVDERLAQRQIMARKRAIAREIQIPEVVDPQRREACLADPELFCATYFPHLFYRSFKPVHRKMQQAIVDAMYHGGCKAMAGPRGSGKTSIIKGTAIWGIVGGLIRFCVIFGANRDMAEGIREDIKYEFEYNDLLFEDFPEVCGPIRALEGSSARANLQAHHGKRTRLRWTGELLAFPHIDGSLASGSVLVCRGIESATKGLVRQGVRPDFAILDDVETRETVLSESERETRMTIVDNDIRGLGGPGERMSIIYLCNVDRRGCMGHIYTDPTQRPAWAGQRLKLMETEPDATLLWAKYMELRQQDQLTGDPTGRTAHAYYLEHQAEMDAGAVLSDPDRYSRDAHQGDGSQLESSALEACYNIIADEGQEHFETQYQCNPPDDSGPEKSLLTRGLIQKRVSGLPRGQVPDWALRLTAFLDCHMHFLRWTIVAWGPGAKGAVIDYGADPVNAPGRDYTADPHEPQDKAAVDAAVSQAILAALYTWRDAMRGATWPRVTGEAAKLDMVLIDSGYMPEAIYECCRTTTGRWLMPSKGFGSKRGQTAYRAGKHGEKHQVGQNWTLDWQPAPKLWLANLDADHWKRFVHDAFLAPEDGPGSLCLFGTADEAVRHRQIAEEITAEVWSREFVRGKGWYEYWDQRSRHNHYFDCLAGSAAAAALCGIRVFTRPPAPATKRTSGEPDGTQSRRPRRVIQRRKLQRR